jgi:hypothetical protein
VQIVNTHINKKKNIGRYVRQIYTSSFNYAMKAYNELERKVPIGT